MFNVRFISETGERQLKVVGVCLGNGSGDRGEQLQTDLRQAFGLLVLKIFAFSEQEVVKEN